MGNDMDPTGEYWSDCSSRILADERRTLATGHSRFRAHWRQHHHLESPGQARGLHQVGSGRYLFLLYSPVPGSFPDKTRGILNEGGLFAERAGWHLPGFDTSPWPSRDLSSGLPDNTAGVGFFVTTFVLDVPRGVDAAMSFVFDGGARTTGQAYRALLFVNGWQYGKVGQSGCMRNDADCVSFFQRVSNIGPQAKFPVPPGILDYNGKKCATFPCFLLFSLLMMFCPPARLRWRSGPSRTLVCRRRSSSFSITSSRAASSRLLSTTRRGRRAPELCDKDRCNFTQGISLLLYYMDNIEAS